MNIRELRAEDHEDFYLLIRMLNPEMTPEQFRSRLEAMQRLDYSAIGMFDEEGRMIAASGFWIGVRFYCGRYMEIDNFVVSEDHRRGGIGTQLLNRLKEHAYAMECEAVVLNAYTSNVVATRFYEAQGFEIIGHHFLCEL